MAKKSSQYPVPKKPYAAFEPSASVTSNVTNRVNTGQSAASKQTSGATGSVSNKVNVTSVQGKAGASGTTSTTTSSPSTPTTPATPATPTTPTRPNPVPAEVAANAAIAAARSKAEQTTKGAISDALTRTGQTLAETRARVVEQMRSQGIAEEHIARVNQAFDTADKTVEDHKKRRGV